MVGAAFFTQNTTHQVISQLFPPTQQVPQTILSEGSDNLMLWYTAWDRFYLHIYMDTYNCISFVFTSTCTFTGAIVLHLYLHLHLYLFLNFH